MELLAQSTHIERITFLAPSTIVAAVIQAVITAVIPPPTVPPLTYPPLTSPPVPPVLIPSCHHLFSPMSGVSVQPGLHRVRRLPLGDTRTENMQGIT